MKIRFGFAVGMCLGTFSRMEFACILGTSVWGLVDNKRENGEGKSSVPSSVRSAFFVLLCVWFVSCAYCCTFFSFKKKTWCVIERTFSSHIKDL